MPTYIAENGNGDICFSDVRAVVDTDAGGMLRFRYQGNSSDSNFDAYGNCCDSSCNIIVADMKNNKLHMAEQDGEFLYHIIYQEIRMPWALCIDKNDIWEKGMVMRLKLFRFFLYFFVKCNHDCKLLYQVSFDLHS